MIETMSIIERLESYYTNINKENLCFKETERRRRRIILLPKTQQQHHHQYNIIQLLQHNHNQ